MIIRSSTVPLGLCCHSSLSLNLSPWLQKLKRLNTYEATLSQVHKLAMPIFCVISLSRVSIFLVGRILLGILYTFNWHRCFDCYIHTLFKSKGAFTPLTIIWLLVIAVGTVPAPFPTQKARLSLRRFWGDHSEIKDFGGCRGGGYLTGNWRGVDLQIIRKHRDWGRRESSLHFTAAVLLVGSQVSTVAA